jgi:hypothetical protein
MSSGSTPNAQGVYSPLPYSDSESEEEVFNKSATHLTERRHESQHKSVLPLFPHANHNGLNCSKLISHKSYAVVNYFLVKCFWSGFKYFSAILQEIRQRLAQKVP